MKTVTFFEGVVIALLASLFGSIGFFALTFFCPSEFTLRLLISALAIVYCLYMLNRSRKSVGRIMVMLAWFTLLVTLWLIFPPLTLFLLLHVLAIWLVRCLYFYSSLFASIADLGLGAFSVASAFWALHHTGSLFLTVWCFFLVQALFVFIPTGIKRPNVDKASTSETDFKRAYQIAEAAIHKLSTFN